MTKSVSLSKLTISIIDTKVFFAACVTPIKSRADCGVIYV